MDNLEIDGSGSEDAFLVSGLIDDSSSMSFENFNSPDPVFEVNQYDNPLTQNESNLYKVEDQLSYTVIEEIEEEILISIDIV